MASVRTDAASCSSWGGALGNTLDSSFVWNLSLSAKTRKASKKTERANTCLVFMLLQRQLIPLPLTLLSQALVCVPRCLYGLLTSGFLSELILLHEVVRYFKGSTSTDD